MNRPSTIGGLAAATLALLVACGEESKSGSPCRAEYGKLYTAAVRLLEEASPRDRDIDTKMKEILGVKPPKKCTDLGPRLANDTLDQVAREFGPQFAALEDKWGRDTLSGFRDPLNAGHGQPQRPSARD